MAQRRELNRFMEQFGLVHGIGDGDEEFPAIVAWRILVAAQLQAHVTAAVVHVAQAKAIQDKAAAEVHSRITSEFIDEICGTGPHPWPWPWPRFVEQLGELAERYPTGSLLRNAAFDLSQRVLARAHELKR